MCRDDGGYYAIKGFLYQFDKTMIELLKNDEDTVICIEKIQDINYEDYIIQVKHKETADFSNSKVRDPIIQLLELYSRDSSRKFCLYGYFKDIKPNVVKFTKVEQLDEILKYRDTVKTQKLQVRFPQDLRKGFINNFTLCFGEDFKNQFKYLLGMIKKIFGLKTIDDAIIHHSLIREKLFELAIKPDESDRHITRRKLKEYLSQCNKNIFYGYYDAFLGREKYIELVKKQYFTIKYANLNKFERLFVIDCIGDYDETTVRKIVDSISNKYYKQNKSPAPYICFRRIPYEVLANVKRGMLDDEIKFSDGTYFDGDRFRSDRLKYDGDTNDVKVKIIREENIDDVVSIVIFKEYYNLFVEKPAQFNSNFLEIRVQINDITEVSKMIS
ncbi:hypothetical protein [Clostridium botulinum]|uniref:hypothetical protein n=1 Tax=Clostridium botulinum TaxID=1491 RepID=UPI0007734926|nr:hypothetical protein [Clostridium botulinum]MBY6951338.1 hypothetical protein [Clostridium botulinum]MCJ8171211.1 hypothetical protein [Clostridium botulinum]MCR1138916.1 hypothetical protein [Clostridium botulinum]NEZ78718.1 hypothetical protein [Clostridium botulinum]NFA16422.1 hypothetical protein [Clostridium botulinum]